MIDQQDSEKKCCYSLEEWCVDVSFHTLKQVNMNADSLERKKVRVTKKRMKSRGFYPFLPLLMAEYVVTVTE